MYPLWNESINYFRLSDNTLRIGMDDENSWNVKDSNGLWEKLIKLCNGKKNELEIIDFFVKKHNVNKEIIKEGLELFNKNGALFLLDKKIEKNDWFNKYKTNILFFHNKYINGIDLQNKFNKLNITIFGLGGGGFTFFESLVSLGIKNFTLIDYDKVEISNIIRQNVWNQDSIGKFKVDLAEEYAKKKDSEIKIVKIYTKIKTIEEAINYITEADWVFSCMDEPPYKLQRIVNRVCYLKQKNLLFAFCQKNSGRFFFIDKNKSGCVDCLFQKIMNEHNFDFISSLIKAKYNSTTAVSLFSLNMLCSVVINYWIKEILLVEKNKKLESNCIYKINFNNNSIKKIVEWEIQKNCITCGDGKNLNEYSKTFFELVKI